MKLKLKLKQCSQHMHVKISGKERGIRNNHEGERKDSKYENIKMEEKKTE